MLGERRADCPNCGGPIEFGLAASTSVICPHCRYSVVRTDRDLTAVGRVADLVPTAAPIGVGDSGMLSGRGFGVRGRLQLDHGAGPWDEWYLAFDDGTWGWLARAQGHWYLTQIIDPPGQLQAWQQLAPGTRLQLEATGESPWVVQEQGTNKTLSAEGELPFPIASGEQGWTVDIVGPNNAFATIDYGSGQSAPKLFVGRLLKAEELQVTSRAMAPAPVEKVELGKMSCPTCGAPVELTEPERTERLACRYCYALLDLEQGNLKALQKQDGRAVTPLIPLGQKGELDGEQVTVAGFMERCTNVDGVTYAWREYLLYTEQGYRWLMEDNQHWLLLKPISGADVQYTNTGVEFAGHSLKRFATNRCAVRFVVGEFYWKVEVGETTHTSDFVAPPRIVSQEASETEHNWSAGSYLQPNEVWTAFGMEGSPPKPVGVAPAQPNPHNPAPIAVLGLLLFIAFVVVAVATGFNSRKRVLVDGPLPIPAAQTVAGASRDASVDRAMYSDPFEVRGPTVLAVNLQTSADNDFVGVQCALINEETGDVREFYISAEYYRGRSGGESWTEGSRNSTEYIDQVPSGRYTLRFDPEWNHYSGPGTQQRAFNLNTASVSAPTASIRVLEGSRSSVCCMCSFFLLLFPIPIAFIRRGAFESTRWKNANP